MSMDFTEPQDAGSIREAVRALCERYPGEYWRALEPDGYPNEFVAALTEHGWLAALIPEQYGGAAPPPPPPHGGPGGGFPSGAAPRARPGPMCTRGYLPGARRRP